MAVCVAVLLGTVGAYSYFQASNSNQPKMRTFNFEWSPYAQNVTDGFLQMNLTFMLLDNGNLSVVAKINDDDYNGWDYLGVKFDAHEAGSGVMFYVSNRTKLGHLTPDGFMQSVIPMDPVPSLVHTCTFNGGYTFDIELPIEEPFPEDIVHVCFFDADTNGGVSIRFYL